MKKYLVLLLVVFMPLGGYATNYYLLGSDEDGCPCQPNKQIGDASVCQYACQCFPVREGVTYYADYNDPVACRLQKPSGAGSSDIYPASSHAETDCLTVLFQSIKSVVPIVNEAYCRSHQIDMISID